MHLTKIYTRTGDKGTTAIANNLRLNKFDPIIKVIGEIDEANSAIGMATEYRNDIIDMIQNDLFDIGAELAQAENFNLSETKVVELEHIIDDYNSHLEPLNSFVLPTGPLHHARTVVRRAEREVWLAIELLDSFDIQINPVIPMYLNRLSDLLFVMARYHNKDNEKLWNLGIK
jgi:cob(I)alamin adenosyltransferase